MLTKRVIPCLDVRAGRVTKGVKFKNNVDLGDPVEMAVAYSAGGADELVVIGTSDAILPSRRRAAYHLPQEERARAAELVKCVTGVREFVILNTCNRVEVVARVSPHRGAAGQGLGGVRQSPAVALLKRITRLEGFV